MATMPDDGHVTTTRVQAWRLKRRWLRGYREWERSGRPLTILPNEPEHIIHCPKCGEPWNIVRYVEAAARKTTR